LASGSTYHTTADAWQTGNFYATSNQVNACDNTANNFRLAQVKLEQGQVATPWKARLFEEELALCQRYYEKSYNITTDPGSATTVGIIDYVDNSGAAARMDIPVTFTTKKRTTATVVLYDDAGTANRVFKGSSGKTAAVAKQGEHGFRGGTADTTSTKQLMFHYTAEAEL
jgi:hypothetical protein